MTATASPHPPIGGNAPLAESLLAPAGDSAEGDCVWLAAGRDAYLAVARIVGPAVWYLPDFLCPVVPQTLDRAGARCVAYRPGRLREAWQPSEVPPVSVLSWDVAGGPQVADTQAVLESGGLYVEDRCLWAGMPSVLPVPPQNAFVIGSLRKWLGVAEGGWLRTTRPLEATVGEDSGQPRRHIAALLAASCLRRLRIDGADSPALTAANREASALAEASLGIPEVPRPISRLGRALVRGVGDESPESALRLVTARAIMTGMGWRAPSLTTGVLGLRVSARDRDGLAARLAKSEIFAPVHWRDGDWSGAGGRAAYLASATLTLPCPALADEAAILDYVRRLRDVISENEVQLVSGSEPGL